MEAIPTSLRQKGKTPFRVLPPVLPTQHLVRTRCLAPLLPASTPLLALERWTSTPEIQIRLFVLQRFCSTPAHKTRRLEYMPFSPTPLLLLTPPFPPPPYSPTHPP